MKTVLKILCIGILVILFFKVVLPILIGIIGVALGVIISIAFLIALVVGLYTIVKKIIS